MTGVRGKMGTVPIFPCDGSGGAPVRICCHVWNDAVIGALSLWSQRRKIRGSVARDLLRAEDPARWLDDAASTLHLRTSCPHPAWLVHCAYWAEVPQARLLAGVLHGAEHMRQLAGGDPLSGSLLQLPRYSFPDLAEKIHAIEERYPVLRGLEQLFAAQWNITMEHQLGTRRAAPLAAEDLTPEVLMAGGFHLAIAAVFHASAGLRESLAVTASGMFTLFALARPAERGPLLAIQRASYGWPLAMAETTFVK